MTEDKIPHGTQSGYSSWSCRCEACTKAVNDAQRERRKAKREGTYVDGRKTPTSKAVIEVEWTPSCHADVATFVEAIVDLVMTTLVHLGVKDPSVAATFNTDAPALWPADVREKLGLTDA